MEKLLLRSNFSCFPQYFQYVFNFKSQIVYSFVKCGCLIYFFLNSANLIRRGHITRIISKSPLDFEITGVDCTYDALFEKGFYAYAANKVCNQPVHSHSLIRAFTAYWQNDWILQNILTTTGPDKNVQTAKDHYYFYITKRPFSHITHPMCMDCVIDITTSEPSLQH